LIIYIIGPTINNSRHYIALSDKKSIAPGTIPGMVAIKRREARGKRLEDSVRVSKCQRVRDVV
jgi:hypothetical protein